MSDSILVSDTLPDGTHIDYYRKRTSADIDPPTTAEMALQGIRESLAEESDSFKGRTSAPVLHHLRRLGHDDASIAAMPASDLARHAAAARHRVQVDPFPGFNRVEHPFVGRIVWHGLPIGVENEAGSHREGVDKDGTPWRCMVPSHYGELQGMPGPGNAGLTDAYSPDGDRWDLMVDPHGHHDAPDPMAHTVRQMNETGEFDEPKTVLGSPSAGSARALYLAHFNDGKAEQRFGGMISHPIEEFKSVISDPERRAALLEQLRTGEGMESPGPMPVVDLTEQSRGDGRIALPHPGVGTRYDIRTGLERMFDAHLNGAGRLLVRRSELQKGFDPSEARDAHGRWTAELRSKVAAWHGLDLPIHGDEIDGVNVDDYASAHQEDTISAFAKALGVPYTEAEPHAVQAVEEYASRVRAAGDDLRMVRNKSFPAKVRKMQEIGQHHAEEDGEDISPMEVHHRAHHILHHSGVQTGDTEYRKLVKAYEDAHRRPAKAMAKGTPGVGVSDSGPSTPQDLEGAPHRLDGRSLDFRPGVREELEKLAEKGRDVSGEARDSKGRWTGEPWQRNARDHEAAATETEHAPVFDEDTARKIRAAWGSQTKIKKVAMEHARAAGAAGLFGMPEAQFYSRARAYMESGKIPTLAVEKEMPFSESLARKEAARKEWVASTTAAFHAGKPVPFTHLNSAQETRKLPKELARTMGHADYVKRMTDRHGASADVASQVWAQEHPGVPLSAAPTQEDALRSMSDEELDAAVIDAYQADPDSAREETRALFAESDRRHAMHKGRDTSSEPRDAHGRWTEVASHAERHGDLKYTHYSTRDGSLQPDRGPALRVGVSHVNEAVERGHIEPYIGDGYEIGGSVRYRHATPDSSTRQERAERGTLLALADFHAREVQKHEERWGASETYRPAIHRSQVLNSGLASAKTLEKLEKRGLIEGNTTRTTHSELRKMANTFGKWNGTKSYESSETIYRMTPRGLEEAEKLRGEKNAEKGVQPHDVEDENRDRGGKFSTTEGRTEEGPDAAQVSNWIHDQGSKEVKHPGLKPTEIGEHGATFRTGHPVDVHYHRNTEKAPKAKHLTQDFGQAIEPSGRYMLHDHDRGAPAFPGWEKGKVQFKNPIVLEHGTTTSEPHGWKARLSAAFGGKKGKALSKAIAERGHDGIVTVEEYQHAGKTHRNTSEIVDLTHLQARGMDKGSYAERRSWLQQAAGRPVVVESDAEKGRRLDPDSIAGWRTNPETHTIFPVTESQAKEHPVSNPALHRQIVTSVARHATGTHGGDHTKTDREAVKVLGTHEVRRIAEERGHSARAAGLGEENERDRKVRLLKAPAYVRRSLEGATDRHVTQALDGEDMRKQRKLIKDPSDVPRQAFISYSHGRLADESGEIPDDKRALLGTAGERHREAVKKRIAAGQEVSPDVMEDYPELKGKAQAPLKATDMSASGDWQWGNDTPAWSKTGRADYFIFRRGTNGTEYLEDKAGRRRTWKDQDAVKDALQKVKETDAGVEHKLSEGAKRALRRAAAHDAPGAFNKAVESGQWTPEAAKYALGEDGAAIAYALDELEEGIGGGPGDREATARELGELKKKIEPLVGSKNVIDKSSARSKVESEPERSTSMPNFTPDQQAQLDAKDAEHKAARAERSAQSRAESAPHTAHFTDDAVLGHVAKVYADYRAAREHGKRPEPVLTASAVVDGLKSVPSAYRPEVLAHVDAALERLHRAGKLERSQALRDGREVHAYEPAEQTDPEPPKPTGGPRPDSAHVRDLTNLRHPFDATGKHRDVNVSSLRAASAKLRAKGDADSIQRAGDIDAEAGRRDRTAAAVAQGIPDVGELRERVDRHAGRDKTQLHFGDIAGKHKIGDKVVSRGTVHTIEGLGQEFTGRDGQKRNYYYVGDLSAAEQKARVNELHGAQDAPKPSAWTDQHRQLAKERWLDPDVHTALGGHASHISPENRAAVQANAPDLLAQHEQHLKRAALLRDKAPHEMSEAEFVDAHTDPDFARILGRDGHGEKYGRALTAVWTPEKHAQWEAEAEKKAPAWSGTRVTREEGEARNLSKNKAYYVAMHRDMSAAARPAPEVTRAKLEQTSSRSKVDYHAVAADVTARLHAAGRKNHRFIYDPGIGQGMNGMAFQVYQSPGRAAKHEWFHEDPKMHFSRHDDVGTASDLVRGVIREHTSRAQASTGGAVKYKVPDHVAGELDAYEGEPHETLEDSERAKDPDRGEFVKSYRSGEWTPAAARYALRKDTGGIDNAIGLIEERTYERDPEEKLLNAKKIRGLKALKDKLRPLLEK